MNVFTTEGGTKYSLGRHALVRMARRSIRRDDVEHALDFYDVQFTDRKGNLCFVAGMASGGRLRVVVVKDSNPLKVITVIRLD